MENSKRMRIVAFGLTDVGLQREHNEDSFLVLCEHELFMVADGMGGHRAGDVASRVATETMADFFHATANDDVTWPYHFDTSMTEEENRLLTGIRIANRQVYDRSARTREFQGMGTTMVTALFSHKAKRLYISHVGDSRCYRLRDGQLRLMTRDHSLVNDYLLAMPELTEEQQDELPKNVITRALGMQDQVVVDMQTDNPQQGDVYLLCSDGLSGMICDEDLLTILASSDDPKTVCQRLIDEANSNGGEDNITAVVIRVVSDDAEIESNCFSSPNESTSGCPPTERSTAHPLLNADPMPDSNEDDAMADTVRHDDWPDAPPTLQQAFEAAMGSYDDIDDDADVHADDNTNIGVGTATSDDELDNDR